MLAFFCCKHAKSSSLTANLSLCCSASSSSSFYLSPPLFVLNHRGPLPSTAARSCSSLFFPSPRYLLRLVPVSSPPLLPPLFLLLFGNDARRYLGAHPSPGRCTAMGTLGSSGRARTSRSGRQLCFQVGGGGSHKLARHDGWPALSPRDSGLALSLKID